MFVCVCVRLCMYIRLEVKLIVAKSETTATHCEREKNDK